MWLLSPLTWLLLAALFACLAGRRRGRWLQCGCAVVAGISLIAMTPMVANLLVGWLEAPRALPAHCRSSPPGIAVVLAGAVDIAPKDADDFPALNLASRRRVERAVAWWRAAPGRSLIISGGPQFDGGIAISQLMAVYARRLGIAGPAVDIEAESTSTWDNARQLTERHPALPRRVVVITSAMHMPRARLAMERAGFEVCAIAADPRHIPVGWSGGLMPRSSALVKTEAALHELVGIAYYHWLDTRERSQSATAGH